MHYNNLISECSFNIKAHFSRYSVIIAYAEDSACNFNKSIVDNATEIASECIQRMKKVQTLELWDGEGKAVSVSKLNSVANEWQDTSSPFRDDM